MTMKNLRIIMLAGLLTLGSVSCKDVLDIQPQNAVLETTFWKTEKDLTAAVSGVYDVLQDQGMLGLFGILDGMTPIGHVRTVATWSAFATGNFDPTHEVLRWKWNAGYRGIVRANDVLAHLDQMSVDENLKKVRKGETLFLRPLFYFNLVYIFGDVPLIENVPTLEDPLVARTPKAQVIEFMLKDLDQAIELLPKTYSSNEGIGRATKGAALTLKAKILLFEKRYAEAAQVTEEIINLGVYSLFPDYRGLFLTQNENNQEVIFDVQFISLSGKEEGNIFDKRYTNQSSLAVGFSWLQPTVNLLNLYETKDGSPVNPANRYANRDPRLDFTILRPGATFVDRDNIPRTYPNQVRNSQHSQTGLHIRKNVIEGDQARANDSPNNWIYFRYADVLLMYAEAKLETLPEGIVTDMTIYNRLNQVRQRPTVNMPPITVGKTKAELREIIRKERAVELALEGWYFFDIRRWGIAKQVMDGFQVKHLNGKVVLTRRYEDHFDLWPIPQNERDINPELTQNPGYPN